MSKVTHKGLAKPDDPIYQEGYKINILPQPKKEARLTMEQLVEELGESVAKWPEADRKAAREDLIRKARPKDSGGKPN